MMFDTLQGLTIPEGVITQIAKDGVIFWSAGGDKAILEVAKITSDTYAGETTYENEEFILLDIYPKTNGTVKVTYGGLSKTVTDTSGAEVPNAQQVFFGTLYGVSDDIETPASGTLKITGDYNGFGYGTYAQDNEYKKSIPCCCITAIEDVGTVVDIPASAFEVHSYSLGAYKETLKKVILKDGVESINDGAFHHCTGLEQLNIPASVSYISPTTFSDRVNSYDWNGTFLTIDEDNANYSFKGSCLIKKANNRVIFGFSDATIPQGVKVIDTKAFYSCENMSADFVIPEGVTHIGDHAFASAKGIVNLTIPSSVTHIGTVPESPGNVAGGTFYGMNDLERVTILATTPPTVPASSNSTYLFNTGSSAKLISITVPKGCGSAYKSAPMWKKYADYIAEAN